MPENQERRNTFFVYIVESPSAPDIYHGRSEGGLVVDALRLDHIPSVMRTAITPEAFVAALQIGLPEAMKQFPGRYPILHISAHGGLSGIQLSNGVVLTWIELRRLLVPINSSLQGCLLLCMSACEGYQACQMAMEEGDAPHPYFAMIGSYGKPTWSDTAVSYFAFYHLLLKGRSIPEAVNAMKIASGDDSWVSEAADVTKRGFIEYLRAHVEPAAAQLELENVAAQQELSSDAKALEASQGG